MATPTLSAQSSLVFPKSERFSPLRAPERGNERALSLESVISRVRELYLADLGPWSREFFVKSQWPRCMHRFGRQGSLT